MYVSANEKVVSLNLHRYTTATGIGGEFAIGDIYVHAEVQAHVGGAVYKANAVNPKP
jgi:hypothetical protein